MKRLAYACVIGCALLAMSALAVQADGLGDGWNRSGLYAGVLGAYNSAELKAEEFKFSDGHLAAGGFGGFNYRTPGGPVVGIEADYMFLDVKASRTVESVTVTASANYLASVRARLGAPIGPAMIYVTGGVAFTNQKLFATDGETSAGSKQDMLFGGVIGAGIEAELTKSLFVRVEALHYVFPDKNMPLDETVLQTSNRQTLARAAFGFKF